MTNRTLALGSAVSLLALIALVPEAAAQAQVEPSVTVSGNGGYSSNPFLTTGNDVDAFVTQIDVRPMLDQRTERDMLHFEAFYTRTDYLENFDGNDGFGALLNSSSQIDENSKLRANISFDSSVLGVTQPILSVGGGAIVDTPVAGDPPAGDPLLGVGDLPDGDIGLIGLRQRRNSLSLEVTAELRTGPRSTWTFSANAAGADYPRGGLVASSYRSIGISASNQRELSETASVGLRGDAYAVDYRRGPTSKVYTLQGYGSLRLAESWTLEATGGVSVLEGDENLVMFSGQTTICDAGRQGRFCFVASRAPVVSGFSGVRGQTSVGASYDYKVDAHSNLGASASYVWTGRDPNTNLGRRRFLTANATYRRDMGGQLSLFVALDGRHLESDGMSGRSDIAGRAGASLRFGGRR